MKVTFAGSGPFRRELDQAVDEYFSSQGVSRFAPAGMWGKTFFLLTWLACAYLALVFWVSTPAQAIAAAIALGVATALVGFNIQHDGGHCAYSANAKVNRAMAFALDVLGGSSYFWHFKHNIAHHSYPNVSGWDDDIFIGPLGRLSPRDKRYGFHRFQHIYMWLLYGLLALKWQLFDDFKSIIKPGVASTHVPYPRRAERILFWLGKVIFIGLALVLPLSRHSVADVALIWTLVGIVTGLVLGTVFQLAHCVPEAAYGAPDETGRIASDWSTYQIESAVDFCQDNHLAAWLFGGLNFQIEHHLFPRVCHVHYPALAPIVRRVCLKHGVKYNTHPTLGRAIVAHFDWLRQLGRA